MSRSLLRLFPHYRALEAALAQQSEARTRLQDEVVELRAKNATLTTDLAEARQAAQHGAECVADWASELLTGRPIFYRRTPSLPEKITQPESVPRIPHARDIARQKTAEFYAQEEARYQELKAAQQQG